MVSNHEPLIPLSNEIEVPFIFFFFSFWEFEYLDYYRVCLLQSCVCFYFFIGTEKLWDFFFMSDCLVWNLMYSRNYWNMFRTKCQTNIVRCVKGCIQFTTYTENICVFNMYTIYIFCHNTANRCVSLKFAYWPRRHTWAKKLTIIKLRHNKIIELSDAGNNSHSDGDNWDGCLGKTKHRIYTLTKG